MKNEEKKCLHEVMVHDTIAVVTTDGPLHANRLSVRGMHERL